MDRAIAESPKAILLLGDFNDRCHSWSDSHTNSELGCQLYNLTLNFNLHQLINEPTRGNNLLDFFFTDRAELFNNTNIFPPLDHLDHCTIFSSYNHTYNISQSFRKTIWHYEDVIVSVNDLGLTFVNELL